MRSFAADSLADPAAAWALLARPGRWHVWAPHVRGAWGLGGEEVEAGARGLVRAFGALPVPAVITAKEPQRSWTWRVGPAEMVHRVEPRAGGCRVAIDLRAPAPLEGALALAYGPVIGWTLRRLAAKAATIA